MEKVPVIETKKVKKIFKLGKTTIPALKNVSLKVYAKEFVVLFGPSGVGKSTLLDLIAGIEKPTEGDIKIRGESIVKLKEDELSEHRRKKIGLVFQDFNLIPSMSAVENVALPLVFDNIPLRQRNMKATRLLAEMGLAARLRHKPAELSGGEKQRVDIARALVNNPWILLIDEPTGDLDRKNADEIMDLIQKLNKKSLRTILLVTHDLRYLSYADRVLEMEDGGIKGERQVV